MIVASMALLAGCATALPEESLSELRALRDQRDYFTLRERLDELPESEAPGILYLRASVQHAFNQLEESNATLGPLLEASGLDETLRFESRALAIKNYARQYRYRAAYEISNLVLASSVPKEHVKDADDMRNVARLLKALADVTPQSAEVRGPSTLRLDPSRHVPVRIGDAERSYTFDTGANFSVLMRSEATALGLSIRPAGVEVGTSTDVKILADVAVADRVEIGTVEYRHVVFLVLSDEHLSFPGGFRIPGIIGFPVIEAMGAVTFRSDGSLRISGRGAASGPRNLALEELVPITRVRYGEASLICRLDSGASVTEFYEPFYARYRSTIEKLGTEANHRTGGAGGVREIPAYVLPEVEIEVGGGRVTLKDRPVYTRAIVDDKDNYLFCNVGLDVLGQFPEYTIDFETMSFVLGEL
jgi:predicted aspartyl protease